MIIGIAGKKESGKDTIAKMIMRLDDVMCPAISTITKHNWEVHKFADPLKEIVCILTGCDRKQLEDTEFKNEYYYNYDTGEIKHQSDILYNNRLDKFIDSIGEFQFNIEHGFFNIWVVFRVILQYEGTNIGRYYRGGNSWSNALFKRYKVTNYTLYKDNKPSKKHSDYNIDASPNWIITDCRFPNEVEAVKIRGGVIVRVNRKRYVDYNGQMIEAFDVHPSETALDDYTFDYVIDNNGTLEELEKKVKLIYHDVLNKHDK